MVSELHEQSALPAAVLLMGPTAAGKTGLALALADRWPVSLISVDSAQVYRGMDIGSAKPDAETLAAYPHALIDLRDPEHAYSAADFVADAELAMRRSHALGRLPLLVGGTMMYFRALLYGLDRLPPADPAFRRLISDRAASAGWPALHKQLARLDPESAARILPSDPQRIQRALEIHHLTGQPPSALRRIQPRPRFPSLRLVVTPSDRHILHRRIGDRLGAMIAAGFVNEVRALRERPGLGPDCAAMKSVGYRQAWGLLEGDFGLREFEQRAQAATRQLAKRQLTALRQMTDGLWYDPDHGRTINRVSRQVAGFSRQQGGSAGIPEQSLGPRAPARPDNAQATQQQTTT